MMVFNVFLGDIYLVMTKIAKSTTVQSVNLVKETGQMDSFTICKIQFYDNVFLKIVKGKTGPTHFFICLFMTFSIR